MTLFVVLSSSVTLGLPIRVLVFEEALTQYKTVIEIDPAFPRDEKVQTPAGAHAGPFPRSVSGSFLVNWAVVERYGPRQTPPGGGVQCGPVPCRSLGDELKIRFWQQSSILAPGTTHF